MYTNLQQCPQPLFFNPLGIVVHAKHRSGLCYSQQLPTSSEVSHRLGKKTNALSMWFLQGKRHHAACIQGKLEKVSCQADWGKKETLIECYQKCCRYCLLYILQSGEKKFSLQMWEKEGKKQRFPSNEYLAGVLPESWLVCSSINSSVLYPSVSLREEDVAEARGYARPPDGDS